MLKGGGSCSMTSIHYQHATKWSLAVQTPNPLALQHKLANVLSLQQIHTLSPNIPVLVGNTTLLVVMAHKVNMNMTLMPMAVALILAPTVVVSTALVNFGLHAMYVIDGLMVNV